MHHRLSAGDVSRNLLRARSAASRVPPRILTYAQACSGFRLSPLLAAGAPRDDFRTHLERFCHWEHLMHENECGAVLHCWGTLWQFLCAYFAKNACDCVTQVGKMHRFRRPRQSVCRGCTSVGCACRSRSPRGRLHARLSLADDGRGLGRKVRPRLDASSRSTRSDPPHTDAVRWPTCLRAILAMHFCAPLASILTLGWLVRGSRASQAAAFHDIAAFATR